MGTKDIVSKQAMGRVIADIAAYFLGLEVEVDSVEMLETELRRIESRHVDLLARMRYQDTHQPFILHIETQTSNDTSMPLRMMRYYADIKLKWSQEPLWQYLIYMGERPLTMPDHHQGQDFTYRYRVLDMRTVDCATLLAKDTPESLVLAVLCDFKGRSKTEVSQYIVKRLRELHTDNEKGFRDYLAMLEILAENRNLQDHIKEAEKMFSNFSVEKMPSFQMGREEGREEGREQVALSLLQDGQMSDEKIAKIASLSLEQIQQLRRRMSH